MKSSLFKIIGSIVLGLATTIANAGNYPTAEFFSTNLALGVIKATENISKPLNDKQKQCFTENLQEKLVLEMQELLSKEISETELKQADDFFGSSVGNKFTKTVINNITRPNHSNPSNFFERQDISIQDKHKVNEFIQSPTFKKLFANSSFESRLKENMMPIILEKRHNCDIEW